MPSNHLETSSETDPHPSRRTCATMRVHRRLLDAVPGYADARSSCENHARRFAARREMVDRQGVTVIPVVVHVVYDPRRPEENLSEEQIRSQIDILNLDYRAKNPDLANAPAVFRQYAADARIEFELATRDPEGNETNGITRTESTAGPFPDDDSVKSAARGGADPWPSDRYLNIWVCRLRGGLLGYAQFPGGPPETDGVVVLYSAFGNRGTVRAPFDLGRSTTHEVGHWLNLRHIWGDDGDGCNGSDYVDDTPNQAGPNYGKPQFPKISCGNAPNGDMFMDFLDYVDDAAMCMFTAGQVERMHACLANERAGIGRIKEEVSPTHEPPWPPPPVAPPEVEEPPTQPPGPVFPPFGPLPWSGPGWGFFSSLFDFFGHPRATSPLAPGAPVPYFGFSGAVPGGSVVPPFPSPGGTPDRKPDAAHQDCMISEMFEAQLAYLEQMLRAYRLAGADRSTHPWYRGQMEALFQSYLAVVQAYRQHLDRMDGCG